MKTLREDVLRYAKGKYRTEPEYLWRRFPHYAVLRHEDNRKWYGLIMDIPGRGIIVGDTVFLYATAPVSAILFKCRVTKTDIPFDYAEKGLTITALMKIKLLKRYELDEFTFALLKEEYGIYTVRGPRGIPHSLSEALK